MNLDSPNTCAYRPSILSWIGLSICAILLIAFYFYYPGFVEGSKSACAWLYSAWNPETDYEHGGLVPLLSIYMLGVAWVHYGKEKKAPSLWGLIPLAFGAVLCLLAVRTQQGRVAIAALPFILTSLVWCYWGGRAAFRCAFPFFFLWLSIPLPGFQQATVWMQIVATQGAHWGAGLFGVDTIVEGSNIKSATGAWDTYSIVGGCSGMRSLMALVMISTAWGYLAFKLPVWKRLILALSAIPLAIIGNAFRVTSIFVCAEYISSAFAGKTWHDWSGLIFFFPASMLGIMILHGLLIGEIPFLKKRKVVIRQAKAAATKNEEDAP